VRCSASAPAARARRLLRRLAPTERPVVALDGVDLRVHPGEFFGLVGPNGAGKTTLLKCLSALILPDAGGGAVNGHDILTRRGEVRATTTLVKGGGWTSNFWFLSLRENLEVYARRCGLPRDLARSGSTRRSSSSTWSVTSARRNGT